MVSICSDFKERRKRVFPAPSLLLSTSRTRVLTECAFRGRMLTHSPYFGSFQPFSFSLTFF